MYKSLSAILVCGLLILSGCSTPPSTDEAVTDIKQATAVNVSKPTLTDISNETILSGKVVAGREVSVSPPIPGKVQNVYVKVGDVVNKNTNLFTMDKQDIEKQYKPLQENYNRAITLAEKNLDIAKKNLEQAKDLFELGATSKSQIEQLELAVLQSEIQLQTQKDQYSTNVENIDDSIDNTNVVAPISGVITAVNVVEGTTASNASAAILISENQKPQIAVEVAETLVPHISVGDEITYSIPSISEEKFTAKIRSISPGADPRTQLYTVKFDIPNNNNVAVGMFANIIFNTNVLENKMIIPSESVLTDGENNYVYVVENGNTARKVAVTLGAVSGKNTEITSGLTTESHVIVKGQTYVTDGATVNVTGGIQ